MLPRRFPLAVLILALGSCATPSAPPPPPARPVVTAPARPTLPPPAPASSDWRDWPLTPGNWQYAGGIRGRSEATYGSGYGWLVQLACDRASRTVTLAVEGGQPALPLTIRTSSTARTLPTTAKLRADGIPPGTNEAQLPASDPLLDAMGFSRGRFVIEQGQRRLVVPAWAEVLRVTEDCRG